MKISSRFTVAVHTLIAINTFSEKVKITSDFIASSVHSNAVVIRRIFGQLKDAKIIEISRGTGGVKILMPFEELSLYDVYKAVECVDDELFSFHEHPNLECPVGKNIHDVLACHLYEAQTVMENCLKSKKLADIDNDMKSRIGNWEESFDKNHIHG